MASHRLPAADIFCRVIDNYGDIGVCWRLARRLAHGHDWKVRLWVDDLDLFARFAPSLKPGAVVSRIEGIDVVHWRDPAPDLAPQDVIIEAFACNPPSKFVRQIGAQQVWLNLEYLSAESWVENCHRLPSPQAGGALKHFFFPGFTPLTGGLLREPTLLAERDAWQQDAGRRARYLCELGLDAGLAHNAAHGVARLLTLFCYPDAPVAELLGVLQASPGESVLVVASGVAPELASGSYGNLHLARIPFLSQADYDRLLWCADLNFVRGEDSFVRAQWAGRPLVWNLYPQEDAAHVDKLAAWLNAYPADTAVARLQYAWNTNADTREVTAALQAALTSPTLDTWRIDAQAWSRTLAEQPELADAIAEFSMCRLKLRVRP